VYPDRVEQKQESSNCKSNNIAEVKGIASHLNPRKNSAAKVGHPFLLCSLILKPAKL